MDLKEFAALKVGDKIEIPMTQSEGEVIEVVDQGVKVWWGRDRPAGCVTPAWLYVVNSTAWKHWSKVDDGGT